jgi:hypothetical protein
VHPECFHDLSDSFLWITGDIIGCYSKPSGYKK